jgi:integrase/recombinase XerD
MKNIDALINKGCFAKLCREFVKYKRSIGYNYGLRQCYSIKYMNDYLSVKADNTESLPKKLIEGYIAKKCGESTASQRRRISIIRQFAIFISSLGYEAYELPLGIVKAQKEFIPYIYSKKEIESIIKIADQLEFKSYSPSYNLACPMLLRLLFGCGLRIGEALALTLEDVDLDEGVFIVKQSKFNNNRLVPMSESLLRYTRKYYANMNFDSHIQRYFFPSNRESKPYSQSAIYGQFRKLLKVAGIEHGGRGIGPRLHDARHTYAVYALEQMVQQGMDVYCTLPILSAYMGHRTVESTEKYLRLLPSEHMNIIDKMAPSYEGLFPEVSDYE